MPALVLDLGGVVYRSWPDAAFHASWAEKLGCDAEDLAGQFWGGPEWGLAEVGEISPDACYAALASRLGVAAGLAKEIASQAFASQPDEALATSVIALRRDGVRTAALTNNIAGEATLIQRPELARLFDLVVSSADVGLQKPDLAIYRLADRRLGVSGAEIVFLDDVGAHVEAARALGWRGIQFRSTDQARADLAAAFADLARTRAGRAER